MICVCRLWSKTLSYIHLSVPTIATMAEEPAIATMAEEPAIAQEVPEVTTETFDAAANRFINEVGKNLLQYDKSQAAELTSSNIVKLLANLVSICEAFPEAPDVQLCENLNACIQRVPERIKQYIEDNPTNEGLLGQLAEVMLRLDKIIPNSREVLSGECLPRLTYASKNHNKQYWLVTQLLANNSNGAAIDQKHFGFCWWASTINYAHLCYIVQCMHRWHDHYRPLYASLESEALRRAVKQLKHDHSVYKICNSDVISWYTDHILAIINNASVLGWSTLSEFMCIMFPVYSDSMPEKGCVSIVDKRYLFLPNEDTNSERMEECAALNNFTAEVYAWLHMVLQSIIFTEAPPKFAVDVRHFGVALKETRTQAAAHRVLCDLLPNMERLCQDMHKQEDSRLYLDEILLNMQEVAVSFASGASADGGMFAHIGEMLAHPRALCVANRAQFINEDNSWYLSSMNITNSEAVNAQIYNLTRTLIQRIAFVYTSLACLDQPERMQRFAADISTEQHLSISQKLFDVDKALCGALKKYQEYATKGTPRSENMVIARELSSALIACYVADTKHAVDRELRPKTIEWTDYWKRDDFEDTINCFKWSKFLQKNKAPCMFILCNRTKSESNWPDDDTNLIDVGHVMHKTVQMNVYPGTDSRRGFAFKLTDDDKDWVAKMQANIDAFGGVLFAMHVTQETDNSYADIAPGESSYATKSAMFDTKYPNHAVVCTGVKCKHYTVTRQAKPDLKCDHAKATSAKPELKSDPDVVVIATFYILNSWGGQYLNRQRASLTKRDNNNRMGFTDFMSKFDEMKEAWQDSNKESTERLLMMLQMYLLAIDLEDQDSERISILMEKKAKTITKIKELFQHKSEFEPVWRQYFKHENTKVTTEEEVQQIRERDKDYQKLLADMRILAKILCDTNHATGNIDLLALFTLLYQSPKGIMLRSIKNPNKQLADILLQCRQMDIDTKLNPEKDEHMKTSFVVLQKARETLTEDVRCALGL